MINVKDWSENVLYNLFPKFGLTENKEILYFTKRDLLIKYLSNF